jgi:Glycosyl transferase family 2
MPLAQADRPATPVVRCTQRLIVTEYPKAGIFLPMCRNVALVRRIRQQLRHVSLAGRQGAIRLRPKCDLLETARPPSSDRHQSASTNHQRPSRITNVHAAASRIICSAKIGMKTAICVVVKNEAANILEWIAFHHLIGFDTIFAFDDHSGDGTKQRIRDAGAVLDVRLSDWDQAGKSRQPLIYERLCRRHSREFDWIAFVDADEFIVPEQDDSIATLLSRHPATSALAIPWLMFGSSGHVAKPSGLTIEAFQRRSATEFEPNRQVKSIVRPLRIIRGINPHFFDMEGDYHLPDGSPAQWTVPGILDVMPDSLTWRIHHYFTRSRAHWQDRLQRGQLDAPTRTEAEFDAYDRNDVFDPCAARFGGSVRLIVDKIETVARMSRSPIYRGLGSRLRTWPSWA